MTGDLDTKKGKTKDESFMVTYASGHLACLRTEKKNTSLIKFTKH